MPRTPDRRPGEDDDEGIILENRTAGDDPTSAGGIRYVNGSFRLKDALGVFDPRSSSVSPGGSNGEVQFNNNGSFSGSNLLKFDKTTGALTSSYFVGTSGQFTNITSSNVYVTNIVDISGYLQLQTVGTASIPTDKTSGYMYLSGSTNDIYFTQYKPGSPYNNTTRLRWMEGLLSTGLLNGGVLSTANGSTTFSLTSGSGIIVSYNASTTGDPYPTVNHVYWPTTVSASLSYITSSFITYIGINSSGGIIQKITPFTLAEDADNIFIGRVLHQSGSVTNGTITSPIVAYGSVHWHDDFTRAFGPLKISGHVLSPSGSTLGLTKTGGDSYAIGRNYISDPNKPNTPTSVTDTDVTISKIFREYVSGSTVRLDTGVGNAGYTSIDPANYNSGGTLTPTPTGKYTIQRVFWFPNSSTRAFTVYYGNSFYNSLDEAQSFITTEQFTEGDNTVGASILVGYVLVKSNATNLSNTSDARFIQAGLFRGASAGGGGGAASPTTPGGLDTYVQFNDGGSTFGGDSGLTYNKTTKNLTIAGDLAVNGGDLTSNSTTFNLLNSGVTTLNVGSGATTINMGNSGGTNIISGTTKFPNGLSGSLTKLTDDTSYIVAGTNISVSTGSNGSITIGNTAPIFYQWNELATSPRLNTTASVAIAGGLGSSYAAETAGTDTFFFVSGTIGGATQKKTVFGGDVLLSGTIEFPTASNPGIVSGSGMLIAGSVKATSTAEGRSVTVAAGAGSSTIAAGSLRLNAGASGGSSSTAGSVTINAGGSTTTATAGSVTVNAGDTSSTSASANAGNVTIAAGSLTGGSPTGQAGAVEVRTGAAASTGVPGNLTLTSQRGKIIVRQSTTAVATGTNVFFFVTGTIGGIDRSVFAGDVLVSGSITGSTGIVGLVSATGIDTGALVFGGSAGLLTGSTSRLNWDNTNGYMNVGTTGAVGRLYVSGSSTGTVPTVVVRHGVLNGSSLPIIDVQQSDGTSVLLVSGSGNATLGKGNLVIGTSGKGIDFSATSDATGMTAELFNDYEEGTWTPGIILLTGSVALSSQVGRYTKVGRKVTVTFSIGITGSTGPSGQAFVTNLPWTASATGYNGGVGVSSYVEIYGGSGWGTTFAHCLSTMLDGGLNYLDLFYYDTSHNWLTNIGGKLTAVSAGSPCYIDGEFTYFV